MDAKIELVCDRCGKKFLKYAYRKAKHNYCSKKCVKNPIKHYCKGCGKELYDSPSIIKSKSGKTYCSPECRKKDRRIVLKCQECGAKYEVFKSRQWTGGRGSPKYGKEQRKYCSRKCQIKGVRKFWNSAEERKRRSKRAKGSKNSNWRGGTSSWRNRIASTREYKDWRHSIFVRDKWVCQECGQVGGGLCAHHIIAISIDRSKVFDLDNGITLCRECHMKTDSYLVVPKTIKG